MDRFSRDRKTGRYSFEGDWDRVCVCGRRLGDHDAEAPHGFGDLSMDSRELPDCSRFRPSRPEKRMTEAERRALEDA
jgi:hypothetical protein